MYILFWYFLVAQMLAYDGSVKIHMIVRRPLVAKQGAIEGGERDSLASAPTTSVALTGSRLD